MQNQTMVYLPVSSLKPHPLNPRRQLGDLTELSDSIKKNGIMQNLTVVDNGDDTYTVIIGHRRCAAAELAGLETVPCIIADLDDEKQLETMLLENMQRSDLTVYEEAQGFQLLIDLGNSIDNIAEKTGLSSSTIRRRTKLLNLDKAKFKESQARNVTMADYMELDKLDSVELKNKVLEDIGTPNFKNSLERAIREEKTLKWYEETEALLTSFAKKVDEKPSGFGFYETIYENKKISIPFDTGTSKYAFVRGTYSFTLYKENFDEVSKVVQAQREKQKKETLYRNKVDELNERMFKLRTDFVRDYVGKKEDTDIINRYLIETLFDEQYADVDIEYILSVTDYKFDEDGEVYNLNEEYSSNPRRSLLATALSLIDRQNLSYVDKYTIKDNRLISTSLNKIYMLLTKLGYQMSDEEKQLRDGTHEIFMEGKDDD